MTAADVVKIVEMYRRAQLPTQLWDEVEAEGVEEPALRGGNLTHNEKRMLRRLMFTPGAVAALNSDQRTFLNNQGVGRY